MLAHHISFYVSIMSETATGDQREAGRYEIRLKGTSILDGPPGLTDLV
jgi:hypothetical protein